MGMAHSTSGRCGFDEIKLNPQILAEQDITLDTVITMRKRENDLRLSEEYQRAYRDAVKSGFVGFIAVSRRIQHQVAHEFGYDPDFGSLLLQSSLESMFPNMPHEEVKRIDDCSLYRKYNRMSDGSLSLKDLAPQLSLFSLDGIPANLLTSSFQVLIAGSIT